MATFETLGTRGTIIDDFATSALLEQVARDLGTQAASFSTQLVLSRGLGTRAGESHGPRAQLVRRLRPGAGLETCLDGEVRRALKRAIRQVTPEARRVWRQPLSVFALENGTTLRLDLVGEPALATDVTLTFICGMGGGAQATLRAWCGPLTGCSQTSAPAVVELKERQAVLLPALWPAELLPLSKERNGEPLFTFVVPVRVETR